MADRTRRWAIVLGSLAIVAMLLLAAGLSSLELLPGHAPAREQVTPEIDGGQQPAIGEALVDLIVVVLGILSVLLVAFFALYLVFADTKKRLLIALVLLTWLLILYLVSQARPRLPEEQPAQVPAPAAAEAGPAPAIAPGLDTAAVDLDPRPPGWLVWVGATALALLAVGLATGITWLVWSQTRQQPSPLERLAREAEQALGALEAGANLSDTILRCYSQMSQILKQERGIVRQEAMTPREFERGLRGTGLPQEAVAHLTSLFEKVRYGARVPEEEEEQQAMACLRAIAEACRSAP